MTTSPLRTGIIGLGIMGADHARHILAGEIPEMILVAALDKDPRLTASFAGQPGLKVFDTLDAFLAADLDAVVIATPHYSHTPLGIAALDRGLHVLIEKPISVHLADARRLIAAHRDPGQVFAAMFNQRMDPAYLALKRMIASGELGAVQRVTWIATDWYRTGHYYRLGGWRATWAGEGGGVLTNQCPHQLDLYQWIFGRPSQVYARAQFGRFHDIEVEDTVTAIFEHEDGMLGTFITTTGEAPGTNRLEVAADGGKLIIENRTLTIVRNASPASTFSLTSDQPTAKPAVTTSSETFADVGPQHVGILRNFAAACLHGEPLVAPAAEGLHSLELANAMLLSSHERRPLSLPLDTAAFSAWLEERIASSPRSR